MGQQYSHLSSEERILIEKLHCEQHLSVRKIAEEIGRDKSTVSRELRLFLVKSVFRVSSLFFFGFRHEECRPVVCFTGCPSCRT